MLGQQIGYEVWEVTWKKKKNATCQLHSNIPSLILLPVVQVV